LYSKSPWALTLPNLTRDSVFVFPPDALSKVKVSLSLVDAEDPKAAVAPRGAAGLLRVWQDRR